MQALNLQSSPGGQALLHDSSQLNPNQYTTGDLLDVLDMDNETTGHSKPSFSRVKYRKVRHGVEMSEEVLPISFDNGKGIIFLLKPVSF